MASNQNSIPLTTLLSTSNKNVSFTNGLTHGSSNIIKHVCLKFWICEQMSQGQKPVSTKSGFKSTWLSVQA
ncbi:hypothetical protein GLYMA_13G333600v4 [Glycine max]|uniref:Uncharacterized protein n=1 Tax=Glycine max TaxID=3847 RepID=K7M3C9_SOYBN|nr:hypothetical protein GYH30_038162 [Glycine max]KRH23033.1 hypothetical protein GLYMA_13G333600v4 [Glycine max]